MMQSWQSNIFASPADFLRRKVALLDSVYSIGTAELVDRCYSVDDRAENTHRWEKLPLNSLQELDRRVQFSVGTNFPLGSPLNETESRQLLSIREAGGTIQLGVAGLTGSERNVVYSLHKKRALTRVFRGVYRTYDADSISHPDFFHVSVQYPKGVICLVSALIYYELTDEISTSIQVAIPSGSRTPKSSWPPVTFYRFSKRSFNSGIRVLQVDGVPVKIYSVEKTIADCFKFRHQVGESVPVQALKTYLMGESVNIPQLMEECKICRVSNIIRPYIQGILI